MDGWRVPQVALASDRPVLDDLLAGRVPAAWAPLDTTTDEEATFLAPLDPVSARGRAKPLFDFDYVWEVYKPAHAAQVGLLHAADPVGRPAGGPLRQQARPGDRDAWSSTASGSRTERSRGTRPSPTRWGGE